MLDVEQTAPCQHAVAPPLSTDREPDRACRSQASVSSQLQNCRALRLLAECNAVALADQAWSACVVSKVCRPTWVPSAPTLQTYLLRTTQHIHHLTRPTELHTYMKTYQQRPSDQNKSTAQSGCCLDRMPCQNMRHVVVVFRVLMASSSSQDPPRAQTQVPAGRHRVPLPMPGLGAPVM